MSFYNSKVDFERFGLVEVLDSEKDYRDDFSRDLSRLIHSASFRRLSGKTQIFPGDESDFFRNRLTHSIEVADIARSIASLINNTDPVVSKWKREDRLNLDLINFSCYAHDLGHPPFGHVGERALDECMETYDRFEGNAQTLRILTKVEKKQTLNDGPDQYSNQGINLKTRIDERLGLNLTYRSILSILKYDSLLEAPKDGYKGVDKGFYHTEEDSILKIKEAYTKEFGIIFSTERRVKTIECSIMDLADDITYTTYDLEDALKAGFISIEAFFDRSNDNIYKSIIEDLEKRIDKLNKTTINGNRIYDKEFTFVNIFGTNKKDQIDSMRDFLFELFKDFLPTFFRPKEKINEEIDKISGSEDYEKTFLIKVGNKLNRFYDGYSNNGYWRRLLCSGLVKHFVKESFLILDSDAPPFSVVMLKKQAFIQLEILKKFIYYNQIRSNRIQIVEYRGKEIIKKIFSTLTDRKNKGYELLPSDIKFIYLNSHANQRPRIVADYIAGMTNKYAVEFYGRLTSENPQTIFKPL